MRSEMMIRFKLALLASVAVARGHAGLALLLWWGSRLLDGTDGVLRYRPEHRDLAASLPSGEQVLVQLSPARRRVTITRTAGDCEFAGSADLPPHLVERAG